MINWISECLSHKQYNNSLLWIPNKFFFILLRFFFSDLSAFLWHAWIKAFVLYCENMSKINVISIFCKSQNIKSICAAFCITFVWLEWFLFCVYFIVYMILYLKMSLSVCGHEIETYTMIRAEAKTDARQVQSKEFRSFWNYTMSQSIVAVCDALKCALPSQAKYKPAVNSILY